MSKKYIKQLRIDLYRQKKSGLIDTFEYRFSLPLNDDLAKKALDSGINSNLIELYRSYNGFEMNWMSDSKEGIGGQIHFLSLEEVVKSWEGYLFENDDVAENADIRFFHPLDLITEEAQCGIIIDPTNPLESLFYNQSSETDIYSLDLNFQGYLEMAHAAKAFFYWPKVLLDISLKKESSETQTFKKHMPKIFSEFNWNDFVAKYESLRLSKQ